MRITVNPGARLPVGISWADWLLREDTTMGSSTWTLPAALGTDDGFTLPGVSTRENPGLVVANALAAVWIEYPQNPNPVYELENRITTPDGHVEYEYLQILPKRRPQ